jgi:hypothetical protein
LRFLKALETKQYGPSLALGSTAEFEGQPFTIIGFMVRSVEFDGVRYFWDEYLLYNPAVGFRWLVQSDNHWNFVRPVAPGEISEPDNKGALFRGKRYKIFQDAMARAEYVQGEFYWRVEAGELARAVDYINAPEMLSKEESGGYVAPGRKKSTGTGEINWSLGTYVPLKEIERKFGVDLPSPSNVAPNQPFRHKSIYKYWALLSLAAIVVGIALMATGSRRTVFNETYSLQPAPSPTPDTTTTVPPPGATGVALQQQNEKLRAATVNSAPANSAPAPVMGSDGTQVIFSNAFNLDGRQNIRVSGAANVENNWLYVAGDLINEETGLVQSFDLPIEYYHGTDEGEAWSEGGREDSAHLSALPAGRYTLRLEAQWEKWNQAAPPQLTVRVEQGVANPLNLVLTLVALSLIPIVVAIYHFNFERRRWADSAFNPYDSGGGGDDE